MHGRKLTDAELDLTCINCNLKSNLTVGVDFEVDVEATTCAVGATDCFKLSSAALNLTVEELALGAALEVFIGKEISAGTNYKCASLFIFIISQ